MKPPMKKVTAMKAVKEMPAPVKKAIAMKKMMAMKKKKQSTSTHTKKKALAWFNPYQLFFLILL